MKVEDKKLVLDCAEVTVGFVSESEREFPPVISADLIKRVKRLENILVVVLHTLLELENLLG